MAKRSQLVARLPADLDALELPRTGVRWLRDARVSGLRLKASNRGLTWVLHARIGGKPRRASLGKYPRMTLDAARLAAGRLADRGVTGPSATLGQLREEYLESVEFKALAERTRKSYAYLLRARDVQPLMARKARELTRQDFLAVKDAIAREDRVPANYLRPSMALCSWALDRGFIDHNPALRLKLSANQADPQPFTEHDVGEMVAALKASPEPMRTLGLLVAFTGQRTATWTDACWAELDLRNARLTVARSRGRKTKLGAGWAVPLPAQVVGLLREQRKRHGRHGGEYLFGYPLSIRQKQRDKLAKLASMADAANRGSLHRFRSTFLSTLNGWGVPAETQLALAGHASPLMGSRRHYVVPIPSKAQVEVMQRYADHVERLWFLGADRDEE